MSQFVPGEDRPVPAACVVGIEVLAVLRSGATPRVWTDRYGGLVDLPLSPFVDQDFCACTRAVLVKSYLRSGFLWLAPEWGFRV